MFLKSLKTLKQDYHYYVCKKDNKDFNEFANTEDFKLLLDDYENNICYDDKIFEKIFRNQ